MQIRLHIDKEDWHNYAGTSMNDPAPAGYILATSLYNATLEEILSKNLSETELKETLLSLVTTTKELTGYAETYMKSGFYRAHPNYVDFE